MPVISVDPGSTWVGKKKYIFELIKTARDCGADVVKFQLFKGEEFTKNGNIELHHELFKEAVAYGKEVSMSVTASAFNKEALELLFQLAVHHVKFAYSQRKRTDWVQGSLNVGRTTVVSTNWMDSFDLPEHQNLVKLYLHTEAGDPVYPTISKINFDGLFPHRFQGFSCHSVGIDEACEAAKYGANWIECHFALTYSDTYTVPDGKFSLRPKELEKLCKRIKP